MTYQPPIRIEPDRAQVEAAIVDRCQVDDEFRRAFLRDPVQTLATRTALDPARFPRIVVHLESPGEWHLVIPPPPSEELSDVELDQVAGGGLASFFASLSQALNSWKG